MAVITIVDFGDTRDEYSSEYPDCEPLATNFYLYSYWWITIIAQVLLIFNNFNIPIIVAILVAIIVVIIVVILNVILNIFQILSFFLFAILWGFLSRSCPCLDKQDDVMPVLYFQVTKVNMI